MAHWITFLLLLCCYGLCACRETPVNYESGHLRLSHRVLRRRGELAATRDTTDAHSRTLLATFTQRKCVWYPFVNSISNAGICELNDYFVLTLRGRPPSVSARILVFLQYKSSVCISYSTEAACVATASDACAWDRSSGGGTCYLSDSAAYDPEILRGRLYCDGSLLDTAARCALAPPYGGAVDCGAVTGADCVYLPKAQLQGLSVAARTYLRLAGLVSYTSQGGDVDGSNGELYGSVVGVAWPDLEDTPGAGLCVARWLQQTDTLEQLQRSRAANPGLGLLQPDLVGTCNGTEMLVQGLAAASAKCSAAASVAAAAGSTTDAQQGSCVAVSGCLWDEGSSACEPGMQAMYQAMYDPNKDAWVKAFVDAYDSCAAATSSAACAAAGAASPLSIDPSRMSLLRDVLTDPEFFLEGDNNQGGGGTALAGGWLAVVMSGAAVLLMSWGIGGAGAAGSFLGS